MVAATQALFVKKVKELTFPKNPILFGANLRRNSRPGKLNSRSLTSQFHTIESTSKNLGLE